MSVLSKRRSDVKKILLAGACLLVVSGAAHATCPYTASEDALNSQIRSMFDSRNKIAGKNGANLKGNRCATVPLLARIVQSDSQLGALNQKAHADSRCTRADNSDVFAKHRAWLQDAQEACAAEKA